MSSKSWDEIEAIYQKEIMAQKAHNSSKFIGLVYVLDLIPLLKRSDPLNLLSVQFGMFTITLKAEKSGKYCDIIPPSPILTDSSTHFQIIFGKKRPEDGQRNQITTHQIVYSDVKEIVTRIENYFSS